MFAQFASVVFVCLFIAWAVIPAAMAVVEFRDGRREHSLTGRWDSFQITLIVMLTLCAAGAGVIAVQLVRLLWL